MADSALRERKPKKASKSDQQPEKEKDKPKGPVAKTGRSILKRIFLAVALAMAISFVLTGSLFFGYQVPTIAKVKHILQQELVLTEKELAKYDGSDPNLPIYIAIKGRIYDVSAGPSYYGPGGGYSFFAGKDATRAYITGCFSTHLTHDLRGLSDAQIASLKTWIDFYENSSKYFYVGKVIHDPIDPNSEIPKDCTAP